MPHDAIDPVPIAAEIVLALQALVTPPRRRRTTRRCITVGTDRSRHHRQRHPRDRPPARHHPHPVRAHPHAGARGRRAGRRPTSRWPMAPRPRSRSTTASRSPSATAASSTWPSAPPRPCSARAAGARMPHPMMGAEDFSYVLQKVPGAMAFLGARAGRRRLPQLLRACIPTAWCSTRPSWPAASPCTAPWPRPS